jgi:Uma2 family endonuclease
VPPNPTLWGNDHVFGKETILVAEVVSPSSAHDDHKTKPRGCARGGVPLYLVIDAFAGKVRLLSRPAESGYGCEVEVKLGEPLDLPDPWNLTLDTSRLV